MPEIDISKCFLIISVKTGQSFSASHLTGRWETNPSVFIVAVCRFINHMATEISGCFVWCRNTQCVYICGISFVLLCQHSGSELTEALKICVTAVGKTHAAEEL